MRYVIICHPNVIIDEIESDMPMRVNDYVRDGLGFRNIIEVTGVFNDPTTKIVRVAGLYAYPKS